MLSIATEKSWSSGERAHAREEMAGGDLGNARTRVLALQARSESKPGLEEEHDRAGKLLKEIEQRQAEQRSRAG
jgi:hypothetical protein